ncbi:MAG: ABC transporter substrate-binding protein [Rhodospirillaceae bacterium]|nr:ABC transporter substrate-binding protein [Rhodospirillaceae bacterium]
MKLSLVGRFTLAMVLVSAAAPTGGIAAAATVKLGLASLPPGGGNPFTSTARTSWYTWRAVFDTLTQLGPDVAPQPALATAWRNTTPTTWIVDLRRGVTFSNGEPFDAATVIATIVYLQSPAAVQDSVARETDNIAGVRALDDHTLEITTRVPDPMFPRHMGTFAIVPPKAWADLGRDGFARAPVGSGSFKVRRWAEARIDFDAFSGSWRAPATERLEIRELPETATRIAALLSGQIHLASEVGPEDVETLQAEGMTIHARPASSVEVIALRANVGGPLADARVRRALNLAVDREAIAGALWAGLVSPTGQVTPRGNPEHDPTIAPYPYDPAQAKALLAEAGFPDGFSFTTVMSSGTGGSHIRASFEQLAENLSRIGVKMTVRPVPWSQFVRGVLQGEWLGEAFGFEYETLPTGETLRPFRLHSCTWTHPWYCDEAIQPVIAAAKAEFEPAKRRELIHRVLRAYHDNAAAIVLFEQLGLDGVSPKLRGYDQMNGIIPFQTLTVIDE